MKMQEIRDEEMIKMWKAEKDSLGAPISSELLEWEKRTRRKLSDICVSEEEIDKQFNLLVKND